MEPTVIRESKYNILGKLLISALIAPYLSSNFYDYIKSDNEPFPIVSVFFGVIMYGLFIHSLIALIRKKGPIMLTEEGIEIRHEGWYSWHYVDSFGVIFRTDDESSDKEVLVIQLKDAKQIECTIAELSTSRQEIMELLAMYKNNYHRSSVVATLDASTHKQA